MHLIFDFDGTLVDSFQCVIETFNQLADELRFRKIKPEEINHIKNISSKELIQYLKIPFYKIPTVIYKARKIIHKNIPTLMPFNGIAALLHDLADAGFTLGIVTSNSEENVTKWLKANDMHQYFHFIYSESSYLGKKRALNKALNSKHIEKSQAFYIGDETRDIEAARLCEIYSIAVTWGFNSEKTLLRSQPHYVARQPGDILAIGLKSLEK